jgi:hypothetical protein
MRLYLKSALVIFLTVVFLDMHAQIKSGYTFGLNLSSLTLKAKEISSYPETMGGIHLGGFYEMPFTGNFAFKPGLLFSAKGSNYKIDTVQYSLAPVYIEVPLIIAYNLGSDVVKISLFAGPYFACGIGGLAMDLKGNLKDINFGSGENKDLKLFDIGLNFGAGINIKGLLISAQCGIGLANITSETTFVTEMKNKVFGISISRYNGAY